MVSALPEMRLRPRAEIGGENLMVGAVRGRARPHDEVQRFERRQHAPPHYLAKLPTQTVPRDGRSAESRNHESKAGMPQGVGAPVNVQSRRAVPAARPLHCLEIARAGQPPTRRQAFAGQPPPCFDGTRTVNRLRPFRRRRLRISRPHRVFIRARNPCLLLRRRFRGRYVGFIENAPLSGP